MIRTCKFLFSIKTLGIFMLVLMLAPALAQAEKGGKGKGKGGFEEGATGCTLFLNATNHEIYSDDTIPTPTNSTVYCHGTDGQVSVPSRYRHDLKKFNTTVPRREVRVHPKCGDVSCPGAPYNGYIWQSYEFIVESRDPWAQLPAMTKNQVAEMSLGIQIGKQLHIYFGGQGITGETSACKACGGPSDKVWVKCIEQKDESSPCTGWTITTDNLSTATGPSSRACMIDYKGGTNCISGVVEADFSIGVVAIPVPED